jgi:hypothetical protein
MINLSHFLLPMLVSSRSNSERDLPILSDMSGFVSGEFSDQGPSRLQHRSPSWVPVVAEELKTGAHDTRRIALAGKCRVDNTPQ